MKSIYLKQDIKKVEAHAATYLQISSFKLMQRAGDALFSYVQNYQEILVVAGAGNNAGDGFIIALLALKSGINVTVWNLTPIDDLPTDAQMAAQQYMHAGGEIIIEQTDKQYDCIVDAIFGTGLSRTVLGIFEQAIHWINAQSSVKISVDIPSGLDANTGQIRGCAVLANITVSILCYKAGQFTNFGKDLCGQLFLEKIGVADRVLSKLPSKIKLLDAEVLKTNSLVRSHNTHKGTFGTTVIVGGHDGMLGALILAGKAALRSGCGVVEVVSNSSRSVMISIQCPELITASSVHASLLVDRADVLAIGPGLGLNQHSGEVLGRCIQKKKAMVIDADALTLSAQKYKFNNKTVLTPHPKEAARLLQTTVEMIQSDRITAAIEISKLYQATVILKGSGTIVANPEGDAYVCPFGYSGMATAGMGDVLCGMVAGLMAQGLEATSAAYTAVVWHALSAENCQLGNSLIASDVIEKLAQTMTQA